MSPAEEAACNTEVTGRIKRAVHAHYKGTCQYCRAADRKNHVDHIEAKANGGPNILGNVTLACVTCNLTKGTLRLAPERVSIIEARARKAALKILRRAEKDMCRTMCKAIRKASVPVVVTPEAKRYQTPWGSCARRAGTMTLDCVLHTGRSGQPRRNSAPQPPRVVLRPASSARDLTLYFEIDLMDGSISLQKTMALVAQGLVSFANTDEKEIAARYLRLFRRCLIRQIHDSMRGAR